MVAGKGNAQALTKAAKTPKLPPLPKLRVRRPNRVEANSCIGVMSSVLGCWASQGYSAKGCAMLEQELRNCMEKNNRSKPPKSNINTTLARFYPKIIGPHKRK